MLLVACSDGESVSGAAGGAPAQSSSGGASGASGADASKPASVEVTDEALIFQLPEFEVQPGDTFTCFYTDAVTPRDLNVSSAAGMQGPGGHHLTIYYYERDEVKPAEHHPCSDQEMLEWKQVAAAGDKDLETGGEGAVSLPPGYAMKVPGGKQLVVQAHYINTTGAPMRVSDKVVVKLVPDEKVKHLANMWALSDGQLEVPSRASATRQGTCKTAFDMNLLVVLGHMHEWGKTFRLDIIDDAGDTVEVLYEQKWDPVFTSHPPLLRFGEDSPRLLPKGTRLRQTCSWDNTTDEPLTFPREMCISVLYYWPDNGFTVCEPEENSQGPTESCIKPGDLGNSKGVGAHCTQGGGECKQYKLACLADLGQKQEFCTKLFCKTDADCGEEAVCHQDAAGSACVPKKCE